MNLTEQLRLWGTTYAAARAAERAAARDQDESPESASEARRLREQADRLHGEIYSALGRDRAEPPKVRTH